MKNIIAIFSSVLILSMTCIPSYSWEQYDRIIAVVNSISIVESEINNKVQQIAKIKGIPRYRYTEEKSRILDRFIEDALVLEAAKDEAIVISDRRVLTYFETLMKKYFAPKFRDPKKMEKFLEKMMKRMEKKASGDDYKPDKILDPQINRFVGYIERMHKLAFKDLFEEIRSQMRREQVMSIAIGVSPPSKEEALDWYKKNRRKFGDEVWIKHILIRPRDGSISAERKANNQIVEIRNRITAGESFERLARKYSHDRGTAVKGGDMGWVLLFRLAEKSNLFAGHVNQVRTPGTVSRVFKTSMGYHIVKLVKRRPVQFEQVEQLIMAKLYNENMILQFKKWINQRKKESDIKIFMKNYKKS